MQIPEPFAVYVIDKAYVYFKVLYRFHWFEAFWVSRPKNIKFKTLKQMKTEDSKSDIIENARIRVCGYKSSRLYPKNMRFVRVYDSDNDSIVNYISNNFEVSVLEISNLYRH